MKPALLLWALAVLSLGSSARAQSTTLHGCPSELGPALADRLEVELSATSEEVRAALAEGRVALELDCTGDAAVARSRGAEALEQRIEGAPLGELRRIALALVELAEASLAAPGSAPLPPPTGRRPWIALGGGVLVAGAPSIVAGSFGVALEVPLHDLVALVVGADGAVGRVPIPEGAIGVGAVSLGASVRFGGWLDVVALGGGPAVRGGGIVLSGEPGDAAARGTVHLGPWLGLGAAAGASVRLGASPIRLGLEVEAGGIVAGAGALVSGRLALRFADFWFDGRMSVAIEIP